LPSVLVLRRTCDHCKAQMSCVTKRSSKSVLVYSLASLHNCQKSSHCRPQHVQRQQSKHIATKVKYVIVTHLHKQLIAETDSLALRQGSGDGQNAQHLSISCQQCYSSLDLGCVATCKHQQRICSSAVSSMWCLGHCINHITMQVAAGQP